MNTVAVLQARNAELERQLHDYQAILLATQVQTPGRKVSHQQPQQPQEQLDDILESAIVCVTRFRLYADRHCEHFYCSPGGAAIFGYTPDELMNADVWWSRIPPEDQSTIVATNDALFAGQSVRQEYRFRHKNGTLRWIEGTLIARRDNSADCWLVTAVDVDITDRKCAEAALSQKMAREQLMTAMIQQIRQSLDLDEIFQIAVTEVRQFLGCDRVLIYQFNTEDWSGRITYESVDTTWRSLLGAEIIDRGFIDCIDDYIAGRVQCTADIYTSQLPGCYIDKQAEMQVRANLVVPIVKRKTNSTGNKLWGLLAAQYCAEPHEWESHDVSLLQDLAAQLAISLQQAALYQQVKTSETELNNILKTTAACIFRKRVFADGTIQKLYYSPASEQLFGYTPAELLEDPELWRSRVVPEDYAAVIAPLHDSYFVNCPQHIEFRFRHRNGSIRWIATTYNVQQQLGSDRIPAHKLITTLDIDITSRKLAEQALWESQQLLQLVFDTMPQRVFWKDRNSRFLGCNKALVLEAGLESPREFIGKTDFDFPWRASAPLYQADDRDVMANNITKINYEEPMVKSDGTTRWLRTSKLPLRDATGEVIGVFGCYEDITELKQAELALRESEARFQEIAQTIDQIFFIRSATTGEFLYIAPAYETIFGRTCASLYADPSSWLEAIHPDDRPLVSASLATQFAGNSVTREYRIIRPNGEMRWLFAEIKLVSDPAGNPNRFIGFAADITARKHMELALQQSEAKNRAILAAVPDLMVLFNTDGIYLGIIQESRTLFNLIDETATPSPVGQHIDQLLPPDMAAMHQRCIQQALATGEVQTYEKVVMVDQQPQYEEVRVAPIDQQTVLLMIRDIGDRKRAELALRDSETRFRTIFEHAGIGIAVVAAPSFTITQANQDFEQMVGYTTVELARLQYTDFTHPEDILLEMPLIQECANGLRDSYQLEKRYIHKDGSLVWVSIASTVIRDEQGRVQFGFAMVKDIRDRKAAEQALQKQVKREQALNTVIRAIHESLDLERVFTTATREMTQLMEVNRAAIVQYFPERHCWQRLCGWQDNGKAIDPGTEVIPDLNNPFAERLKRGQIVCVDVDHPIQDPINQALAKDLPLPWLLVPIVVNQVTWGSFTLKGRQELRWHTEDIELAQQVAEQLAIAIYQAQLYHQAQVANASLEQLNQELEIEIDERTLALRQSEELFRSLFEHAPIGITITPVNSPYLLEVNQKYCQITGYSRDELKTLTIADVTHPDDVALQQSFIADCLAGTLSEYQMEKRYITKQGALRWTQLTTTLLYDVDKKPLYRLAMVDDITERKQVDEALRRSEAQNRAILAAMPDLLLRMQRDGTCLDFRFPHTLDATITAPFRSIIDQALTDDHRQVEVQMCHRALNTNTLQVYERQIERQGQIIHEEIRISPCGEDEVLLIVRNISDRKQTEAQIQASLREKELLLQEIHHRVKNNLQTICSLLNLQANTFDDPQIIEPLLESQRRVRTMSLVHERLYQTTSLAEIDIADYITDLVQDAFQSSLVDNFSIDLRFDLAHLNVDADTAIACGLIINELVSNALKHAFPDNRPGEICISFNPHPTIANNCLLIVADDGIGIPPTLDVHNTDSLGLQVICALIAQIYGTLEVDRQHGTAFQITIPLTSP